MLNLEKTINPHLPNVLIVFLRSFSQIMLQENTITGLFFIVGIGLGSPTILLGACIATFAGLLTAKLFNYDAEEINRGLYGYNAALVGCALIFFLQASLVSFVLLIIAACLSTIIMHFMLQKVRRVLAFTAPFILSTWLCLLFLKIIGFDYAPLPVTDDLSNHFESVMRGIAQVMFQVYWLSGVLFLCGLFISSISVGIWVIIGSALALVCAHIFNFTDEFINIGVYSFNASLVVIALNVLYSKRIWPIFLAVLITVLMTKLFIMLQIPVLTAPFVLTSWTIIALIRPSNHFIKRA